MCVYWSRKRILISNENELLKVEWYPPSLRLPSSAACPEWNTVFTKIPILPFGESRPPTTLNPRDFLPGPLWNVTVKRDSDKDFGLLGSVPVVTWRPTPTMGATLRLHCRGVTWSKWHENFLIPVTTGGLSSVSLHLHATTISTSRGQFLSAVRASWSVIPRSRWPFTFTSSSPTWKRPSLDKVETGKALAAKNYVCNSDWKSLSMLA